MSKTTMERTVIDGKFLSGDIYLCGMSIDGWDGGSIVIPRQHSVASWKPLA